MWRFQILLPGLRDASAFYASINSKDYSDLQGFDL